MDLHRKRSIQHWSVYLTCLLLWTCPYFLSGCAGDELVVEPAVKPIALSSHWCAIGDTRIHYLDVDVCESDPVLLIVHGYLGSTVSFRNLIESLSRDLRVVMPDLPGFGFSEAPSCSCTMEYYLDFLERFSETVGLESFYLMGTSMGANIAAHYSAAHAPRIRGLIFLSPFGLQDQGGKMTRIKRWDAFLPLASSLVTKSMVRRRLHRSILAEEQITPELVATYWKPFTTTEGRRATVEVTRKIIGGCSMDAVLPRIEQPVLILIGSEDKLIRREDREKLGALLVHEQLQILQGCGHFLYLDSPEVVAENIVKFIRG